MHFIHLIVLFEAIKKRENENTAYSKAHYIIPTSFRYK